MTTLIAKPAGLALIVVLCAGVPPGSDGPGLGWLG